MRSLSGDHAVERRQLGQSGHARMGMADVGPRCCSQSAFLKFDRPSPCVSPAIAIFLLSSALSRLRNDF